MDDELGFVFEEGSDLIHIQIEDTAFSLGVTMCGNGAPYGGGWLLVPQGISTLMSPSDFCQDCIVAWGRYAAQKGGR